MVQTNIASSRYTSKDALPQSGSYLRALTVPSPECLSGLRNGLLFLLFPLLRTSKSDCSTLQMKFQLSVPQSRGGFTTFNANSSISIALQCSILYISAHG